MRKANTDILSSENIDLLDSMMIDCYPLHNSKADELAFASNNHRTREFEIKFMNDGSYRFTTRFLGYRKVMEQYTGTVEKIKDPDGRRYSFKTFVQGENRLNDLIGRMLIEGFDPNPRTELI